MGRGCRRAAWMLAVLMMTWIGALPLAAQVPSSDAAKEDGPSIRMESLRMRPGHDPHWSDPEYDDDDWADALAWYFSPRADTTLAGWIRVTFRYIDPVSIERPVGLRVSALASYELYMDGRYVGRSGQVGSSIDDEVPGPIDNLFRIPDSLVTPGEHVLAVRFSNYHVQRRVRYYFHNLEIGSYENLSVLPIRGILLPLVFLGGFGFIGIYYLLLFLVSTRESAYLLFSLVCFSVMALVVLEVWRWYAGYTFDLHYVRLQALRAATFVAGTLLGLFFLDQFSVPRRRLWTMVLAAGMIGATLLPVGFDVRNLVMLFVATVFSTAIGLWAAIRRQQGSGFALFGVGSGLILLLLTPGDFPDYTFFPSFAVLIICLLASLAVRSRKQREAHEAALMSAARLETELLKKNMQPHFLMNSLTSVMEWIEEDPDTGIRLIDALASEFRLLLDVSDKPRIPIALELELCRSHLVTMSLRSDVAYSLREHDLSQDATVPPALFLTLVENGITHRRGSDPSVEFHLFERTTDGRRVYEFTVPGEGPIPGGSSEGIGLQYVRARLDECYGSTWRLESGPREGGWTTVIDVPE